MAQAVRSTVTDVSDRLLELVGLLDEQEGFAEVVASLRAGHAATLDGVWGSSCALAAAALAAHSSGPLVVVCPNADDVDDVIDDLELFTRVTSERFPVRESLPSEGLVHDEVFGDRVRLLKLLDSPEPPSIVVASIQSLVQPVPDRELLRRAGSLPREGQGGHRTLLAVRPDRGRPPA